LCNNSVARLAGEQQRGLQECEQSHAENTCNGADVGERDTGAGAKTVSGQAKVLKHAPGAQTVVAPNIAAVLGKRRQQTAPAPLPAEPSAQAAPKQRPGGVCAPVSASDVFQAGQTGQRRSKVAKHKPQAPQQGLSGRCVAQQQTVLAIGGAPADQSGDAAPSAPEAASSPVDLSVSPMPAQAPAPALQEPLRSGPALPSLASVLMARRAPAKLRTPHEAAMPPIHVHQRSEAEQQQRSSAAGLAVSRAMLALATQHVADLANGTELAPNDGQRLASLLQHDAAQEVHLAALQSHLHEELLSQHLRSADALAVASEDVPDAASDAHPVHGAISQGQWSALLLRKVAALAAKLTSGLSGASMRSSSPGEQDKASEMFDDLTQGAAALQARLRAAPAASDPSAAWVSKYAPPCAAQVCGNADTARSICDWMQSFHAGGGAASAVPKDRRALASTCL
jgi:hypothetical protein